MRKLVYHVATTLDNYIAHEDGSIGGFSSFAEGDHVSDYLESLKGYDTVVMGKATYEFGYQFGLLLGQPAYPHMQHYVFSKTLKFDNPPDPKVKIVNKDELEVINRLKAESGTDIYLCGGGTFAVFLADHDLIDELRIKLYPLVFGKGIRLFGNSIRAMNLSLIRSKVYQTGAMLITYGVNHK
jgi:dihydrofolate reductase